MKKTVAVVLSGCGVFDGTEIGEAILTLLSLEEEKADYQCFAPDKQQAHVINHLTSEEMSESRNVLVESARIVRGNIQTLTSLQESDYDGLIVVGGYGAAKNLSDFAFTSDNYTVDPDLVSIAKQFTVAQKPIGFICIAPVLLKDIFTDRPITATIGTDTATAKRLESLGIQHEPCDVDTIVIDEKNKVITTPAYMLATSLIEAQMGIKRLVQALLSYTT